MTFRPSFPTILHKETAEVIQEYFMIIPQVDTVLVVNSCARGVAVPESDLDFAVLVKPGVTPTEIQHLETAWLNHSTTHPALSTYKQSNQFALLHLDFIDGNYIPAIFEMAVAPDSFEIEIGNQICYSAPMDKEGAFFQELQNKWLPYYNEELRLKRLSLARMACEYDLDHIPVFIKRELYFQAFDILRMAFQKYLQVLFISNKTYPIAYNKWIKEQVVKWLNKPFLYPKLPPILSISNIESDEISNKANMLRELLNNLTNE